VLSGEFDAMKNCVRCNGGLATILGMAKMRCTVLLSPFDHTQLPFVEEKLVKSSEEPPRSSGMGASRVLHAMKNCVRCNGGLATMSGKGHRAILNPPQSL